MVAHSLVTDHQHEDCGCSPLRVTTWPLGALDPGFDVLLTRHRNPVLVGEWIFLADGQGRQAVAPSPDLYLRCGLHVDVSSPDAALEIVRTGWGDVWDTFWNQTYSMLVSQHAKRHGRTWSRTYRGLADDDPQAVAEYASEDGRSPRLEEWMDSDGEPPANRGTWVHVDSVLWQATQLRIIAYVVLAASGNICMKSADLDQLGKGSNDERRTRNLLETFMFALKRWSPRLALVDSSEEHAAWDPPPFSLLEVGALQAFNDIVSSVTLTPCKHCGRIFGRKVADARYRSRRKGVIYCTKACANAATQARYRARKKAEREALASRGESDGK